MLQHFVYASIGIAIDLIGIAGVLAFSYSSMKHCAKH